MARKKEVSWRCSTCKTPIKPDAYYCKKCGALVSVDASPSGREIDKTLKTKWLKLWRMRAIAKLSWGLIIVASLVSASFFFHSMKQAREDNHSSSFFVMKVDHPDNPFNCSGTICQLTVEIENKTNNEQRLVGTPYIVLKNGQKYGPVPRAIGEGRLYFFDRYCTQSFNLQVEPHQNQQFIGICTQNLPSAAQVALVAIYNQKDQLVLSSTLQITTPTKY